MTVLVPIPNASPYDVFSMEQVEGALGFVGELIVEATPAVVAAAAPAAIVAGGVVVTNELLKWHAWDSFWLSAGGRLSDIWHAAGSFLFGAGGAASLDTVSQLIQLSMHISLRASRQLIGSAVSKAEAISAALYRSVTALAHTVANDVAVLHADIATALAYARSVGLGAERYAVGVAEQAGHAAAAIAGAEVAALRAEIIRDLYNPLRAEVIALDGLVKPIAVDIEGIRSLVQSHLVPEIAKLAATASLAYTLAHAATTFVEDCGEEMCRVQGPNSNLGKLFSKLEGFGLAALLAGLLSENVSEVEAAAARFAETLGPVLADWVEGFFGLKNTDVGGDLAEAVRAIGDLF